MSGLRTTGGGAGMKPGLKASSTDVFAELSKEEQRKALEETLKRLEQERTSHWTKFGKLYDYSPIPAFFDILKQAALGTRYALGEGIKVTEDLLGHQLLNWDDPSNREFRYKYIPLMKEIATSGHFMKEKLENDRDLAIRFFTQDPDAFKQVMDYAVAQTVEDSLIGGQWAKDNPEAVEELGLTIFDPLWASSAIVAGIKTGKLAAEVKWMSPIVEKMFAAKSRAEFIVEAKALHGADIVNPTFYAMVKSFKRHGFSPEDASKLLYTQNYRAAPWSVDVADWIPYSNLLKRGGNLYSEGIKDLADKSPIVLNAVKKEWANAFSRVPKIKKNELEDIQMLLHRVPREPYNPKATFELNYINLLEEGKVPMVPEKTFKKAAKIAEELGAGWRGEVERIVGSEKTPLGPRSKPGLNYKFFEPVHDLEKKITSLEFEHGLPPGRKPRTVFHNEEAGKRMTARLQQKFLSQSDEMQREVIESFKEMDSSLKIARVTLNKEAIRLGKSAKYEWRAAYGPAADTVAKIEGEKRLIRSSDTDLVGRGYEMTREGLPGLFQSVDNFRKWVATVGSRVHRANEIDKVIHESERYKAGLNEAIKLTASRRAGGAAVGDPAKLSSLKHEFNMVNSMIRDLKSWKDSPDFIKALKESESIPVIKAYDAVLNKLRQSQLAFTPSFYWNNLIDSHIWKNFATTGKVDLKGFLRTITKGKPQPAFDVHGVALDFSQTPSQLLYGAQQAPTSLYGKMIKGLGDMMDNIENGARTYAGKIVYDENYGKMIKAGVDDLTADSRAKDIARRAVAEIHFDYASQSATDKVARRLWLYPIFNARDKVFWTTRMINNPAESYALMQLRQKQEEIGFDHGNLKLPGLGFAVDPIRRASFTQSLDLLLHTDEALTPQQEADFRLAKAMGAIMGRPVPPIEFALEMAGALPRSSSSISPLEEAFNIVSKGIGAGTYRPSDAFGEVIGRDPKETRDQYDQRRAAFMVDAFKREGKNIDPQQAMALVQRYDAISAISNISTGFRLVPAFRGYREASKAVEQANYHLRESSLEDQPYVRRSILAEPGNENLDRILPMSQFEKVRFLSDLNERQQAEARAESEYLGPNQEKAQKGQELLETVSEMASPFINLFASPAEGAEPDRKDLKKKLPDPRKTEAIIDPRGNAVVVISKRDNPRDRQKAYEEAAEHTRALEVLLNRDVKRTLGTEMLGKYIDSLADPDGRNFAAEWLERQKDTPQFAPYYEQYLRYKTGGKEGFRDIPPQSIDQTRRSFSRSYQNWLEEGGYEAEGRFNLNLKQVQNLIDQGKFRLLGNVPKEAVDKDAFDFARDSITPGFLFSIKKRATDAQDPNSKYWTEILKKNITHDRVEVENTVNQINKEIGSGRLSTKYWDELKNLDKNTYMEAAVTSEWSDIVQARTRASLFDPQTNRFLGFDFREIQLMAEEGKIPYLAAIRKWGSPEERAAFDNIRIRGEKPGQPSRPISVLIPDDPTYLHQQFEYNMDVRTGQRQPLFDAQISNQGFNFGQPVVAQPKQQKGRGPELPPEVGQERDFGGGPQRTQEIESLRLDMGPAKPLSPTQFPLRRPHGSMAGWISDGKDFQKQWNAYYPDDQISLPNAMWKRSTYQQPVLDVNGKPAVDAQGNQVFNDKPAATAPMMQAFGGSLQLAGVGANLGGVKGDSGLARGLNATSTALTTFGALSSMGVHPYVAAPIAITAGTVALFQKPKKSGPTADQEHAQRERQERHEAQLRELRDRNATQSLLQRERLLSSAFQNATAEQRERFAPRIEAFRRKPTFASRIGLIESLERELSSALKPRY